MKKLLLCLSLFLGWSAQAVNLPQASSAVMGGGPTTRDAALPTLVTPIASLGVTSFVKICDSVASSNAGQYYGLYSHAGPSSLTQFQVPTGKSFYATEVIIWDETSGNPNVQLGYGTAPNSSEGAAGAPTGSVLYGSSASSNSTGFVTSTVPTIISAFGLTFPALSYPYWRPSGSAHYQGVCITGVVQ